MRGFLQPTSNIRPALQFFPFEVNYVFFLQKFRKRKAIFKFLKNNSASYHFYFFLKSSWKYDSQWKVELPTIELRKNFETTRVGNDMFRHVSSSGAIIGLNIKLQSVQITIKIIFEKLTKMENLMLPFHTSEHYQNKLIFYYLSMAEPQKSVFSISLLIDNNICKLHKIVMYKKSPTLCS